MIYNNAIIESKSILSLVQHFNGKTDEINKDNLLYFERARYYDDVRLILVLKHVFDFTEKINLGRVPSSISDFLFMLKSLENGELCNELQGFDETFTKYLIQQDFTRYDESCENLSEILLDVAKDFYNDSFFI